MTVVLLSSVRSKVGCDLTDDLGKRRNQGQVPNRKKRDHDQGDPRAGPVGQQGRNQGGCVSAIVDLR